MGRPPRLRSIPDRRVCPCLEHQLQNMSKCRSISALLTGDLSMNPFLKSGPMAAMKLNVLSRPKPPCIPCPSWRLVSATWTAVIIGVRGSTANVLKPPRPTALAPWMIPAAGQRSKARRREPLQSGRLQTILRRSLVEPERPQSSSQVPDSGWGHKEGPIPHFRRRRPQHRCDRGFCLTRRSAHCRSR